MALMPQIDDAATLQKVMKKKELYSIVQQSLFLLKHFITASISAKRLRGLTTGYTSILSVFMHLSVYILEEWVKGYRAQGGFLYFLYLDEGDAVGWHGNVVAKLVEELRRNPQGGAAKLKLIRPETETRV